MSVTTQTTADTKADTSHSVTVTEKGPDSDLGKGIVALGPWYEDRAKEIRAHLSKMNANADKAEQHRKSALHILNGVEKKLGEATLSDGTLAFDLFKTKVCPELSTSQAYVKLAILTGKLSLEDHRKKQNARQRKSRASKRQAATTAALMDERAAVRTPTGDKIDASQLGPKAQEQLARITGNDGDPTASAEARKAENDAKFGEAPPTVPEDPDLMPLPPEPPRELSPGEISDEALAKLKAAAAPLLNVMTADDVRKFRVWISDEKLWRKKPPVRKAA